jgi:pyruvate kinase
MMESMITSPIPTRAEVSDVANAVLDGTDAVMLSAETATGQYPVKVVEQMSAICMAAENSETVTLDDDFLDQTFTRIDQSIALGALFTAYHLKVKAIAALTESGSTALWMSRHKIHTPIFALTKSITTQRAMAMYRNVTPIQIDVSADRDIALREVEQVLLDKGVIQSGDMVALTVGEPMGQAGGTNTLKIIKVK